MNEPFKVCSGCGSTEDQQWIYPHPSGGWGHADFCMPPDDWKPSPSVDDDDNGDEAR